MTPKKELERPVITVDNKERSPSPSSDSEDKSITFAPSKRSKKRVLSFDESNSSTENVKESPKKPVKQMKTIKKKELIPDETPPPVSTEQTRYDRIFS